jgi:hypothetical protein
MGLAFSLLRGLVRACRHEVIGQSQVGRVRRQAKVNAGAETAGGGRVFLALVTGPGMEGRGAGGRGPSVGGGLAEWGSRESREEGER